MGKKILLVDDDLVVAGPLIDFLKSKGFEVWHAPNGGRGVQIAQREQPDLVLLDLVMPGMNGLEALKLIKTQRPEAKVVMLSGIYDQDIVRAALETGALSYLSKPISLEKLDREVLHRYLI